MSQRNILGTVIISLVLSACGGGGGSDSENDGSGSGTKTDVNVAASNNGGVATAAYNSDSAVNFIDEDATTTWISDPDSSIVVDFGSVEKVKKITITKVNSATSAGSNPDVLVELSIDGNDYQSSNITTFSGGIECSSTVIGGESLVCEMDEYDAQFIRVTSKNGKSFEFKEIEVIANR